MRSRSLANRVLLVAAALAAARADADALVLRNSVLFGKLTAIGPNAVLFAPGCHSPHAYAKADVRRIERNASCTPRPIAPYSAGGEICAGTPLQLYEVVLVHPSRRLLAADVQVSGDSVHIRSADGLTQIHGSASRLKSLTRGLFCRSANADLPPVPGFCRENVPRAVNFGTDPVFANHILTQGLSFLLEDDGGTPITAADPRGSAVREAFGTAVTEWMGALQDLGPALPPSAAPGLAGMISSSPHGYRLLTPPQVVRVDCRASAMFVVRWVDHDLRLMRVAGRTKDARAEVEGRTIWLNAVTHPCWRASAAARIELDERDARGTACVNLTPVLAHEVGHALGLAGHSDRDGHPSIMDSQISDVAARPTHDDALELAAILARSIQGAPAGRMDADGLGVEIIVRH